MDKIKKSNPIEKKEKNGGLYKTAEYSHFTKEDRKKGKLNFHNNKGNMTVSYKTK